MDEPDILEAIRNALGARCNVRSNRARVLAALFKGTVNGIYLDRADSLLQRIHGDQNTDSWSDQERTKELERLCDTIRTLPVLQGDNILRRFPDGQYGLARPWILFLTKKDCAPHIYEDVQRTIKVLAREDQVLGLYLSLYMHSRVPSQYSQSITQCMLSLSRSESLYPRSRGAKWKEIALGYETRLPADLRFSPESALQRLKGIVRLANLSIDCPRAYDFSEEIERAPEKLYRLDILDKLQAFLSDPSSGSIFAIAGGPGTGKSSVMRFLIRQNPQWPHAFIDLQRGERSRPLRILEHLSYAVACASGLSTSIPIPDTPHRAAEILQNCLLTSRKHRPSPELVILIDGLDETEVNPFHEPSLSKLLQQVDIPAGVRFVLASRPTQAFRQLVGDGCIDLDADPFQREAIRGFYTETLLPLAPSLDDPAEMERLIVNTKNSFLYAILLIQHAVKRQQGGIRIDLSTVPEALEQFLNYEWERALQGPLPSDKATRLLAVIAVHQGCPTLDELSEILGFTSQDTARFIGAHESILSLTASQTCPVSSDTVVDGFRHAAIREHFVRCIWESGIRDAHRMIAEAYLRRHNEGNWETPQAREYCYRSVAFHLRESGNFGRLRTLLSDYVWLANVLEVTGTPTILMQFNFLPSLTGAEQLLYDILLRSTKLLARDPRQLWNQLNIALAKVATSTVTGLNSHRPAGMCLSPVVFKSPALSPFLIEVFPQLNRAIVSMAIAPKTGMLFTGDTNGCVYVKDLGANSKEDKLFSISQDSVICLDLSADVSYVLTASPYKVSVLNVTNGQVQFKYDRFPASITCARLSKRDHQVVVGDSNGNLHLFDWNTGKKLRTKKCHERAITSVAFSSISNTLLSADRSACMNRWTIPSLKSTKEWDLFGAEPMAICCLADSELGVVITNDGSLIQLAMADGNEIFHMKSTIDCQTSLALSCDALWAVSGTESGVLNTWFLPIGFDLNQNSPITALRAGDDVAYEQAKQYYCELTARTTLANFLHVPEQHNGIGILRGHTAPVTGICALGDDQTFASCSLDGTVRLWQLTPEILTQDVVQDFSHDAPIRDIAISGCGQMVVSVSEDKVLKVWEIPRGVSSFEAHANVAITWGQLGSYMYRSALQLSENAEVLASFDGGGPVFLFNAQERIHLRSVVLDYNGPRAVRAFGLSHNGKAFAVGLGDGTVSVLDSHSRDTLATCDTSGRHFTPMQIQFSPDDKYLLGHYYKHQISVWRTDTGALAHEFSEEERVGRILEFYGDCRAVIASADMKGCDTFPEDSRSQKLQVINYVKGEIEVELQGYTSGIPACAVDKRGTTLVSVSLACEICFWDLRLGVERRSRGKTAEMPVAIGLSDDGHHAVVAMKTGLLEVWNCRTGSPSHRFICDGEITAFAFQAKRNLVVVGDSGGNLYAFEIAEN